jgi:uncharacterized protein
VSLQGAAGRIQALSDAPATPARGVALIAHPHPLFGGTMDNKVVQTLARAAVATGWQAWRFNFRGVGQSEGVHDAGVGEADDVLQVIEQIHNPGQPLVLAGFSFGAFVMCRALKALETLQPHARLDDVARLVLVGTAAARFEVPALPLSVAERALVIHGEQDDTVPLLAVLDWARPQHLPVTVVPGVEHFFHGQLPLLKRMVTGHLSH